MSPIIFMDGFESGEWPKESPGLRFPPMKSGDVLYRGPLMDFRTDFPVEVRFIDEEHMEIRSAKESDG